MTWPVIALMIAIAGCGAPQRASTPPGSAADPESGAPPAGASGSPAGTPAYIVHATPESRRALTQAVENALAGTRVTLDDDALTQDATLVIERAQRRDPRQLVAEGRDPGAAGVSERFHLVKVGEHCILVHDRTGRYFDLIGTVCAPL